MLFNMFLGYLIFISLVAVATTIYDKLAAVFHKWRISEKTLLIISALGGSVLMLLTMLIIRHKTRKPLFMVGIPVIILAQIAVAVVIMVSI